MSTAPPIFQTYYTDSILQFVKYKKCRISIQQSQILKLNHTLAINFILIQNHYTYKRHEAEKYFTNDSIHCNLKKKNRLKRNGIDGNCLY